MFNRNLYVHLTRSMHIYIYISNVKLIGHAILRLKQTKSTRTVWKTGPLAGAANELDWKYSFLN